MILSEIILHIVADDNDSSRFLIVCHRIFNNTTTKNLITIVHEVLKIPVKPLLVLHISCYSLLTP